ncbi:MAG TPA: LuxR C-terminal-related transcriptional regulator, partial [Actinomycetota bacterium]|nr:LuxR C-terminal-related transcriptional regulator [Actinomycetota bacterium]
ALEALKAELAALPAIRLQLDPLTDGEIATLAENLLLARPSPALLRELDRAGGNPFLATELISSYQREGLIRTGGDQADPAELEPGVLPASLASMIRHRLSFLSDETIYALEVASVLGSTFSAADLAAVLDRPLLAVLDHLHGAAEAGIISGDGRLVSFRHNLIRESLYMGMPLAVRHSLHLAAANALLEAGLPAVEVADHVLRGAAPGDLEAVEWLRTAARQAGSRAPAIAADLLGRARALITKPGPLRDATLSELAMHLVVCGRLAEAERICRSVLDHDHDPAVEGSLRLCLVQVCVGRGRIGDALPEIEAAIRSPHLTPLERARLRAWSATCRVVLWDLPGAADDCAAALEASRALGDDLGLTIARADQAAIVSLRGGLREGLAAGEAALAAARHSSSPEARRLQLTLMHALMLMDVDALDEAQNALRQGRHARERRGARWNLPSYHFVSAIGQYFSGNWDEAIAQFESAMDFAQEVVVYQGQLVGHSLRSMIALHRGDSAVAEREIASAEAEAYGIGPQWRPDWMLWAKGLKSESEGRVAEAMRTLAIAWRMCREAGVTAEYPVIGPDLVRLALASGEGGLAEEVTAALEALASQTDVASVRGAALRCRGLVRSDPALLLEAVQAYRSTPRRWELALACEDAAVALAGTRSAVPAGGGQVGDVGTARRARALADEALDTYRSLDANRELARAQARLRAAGLRTGTRGERQRPRSGWASLTAAEHEVASLVAEGLGNPEIAARLFISRRTVQSHVSHILEKLDLTSRVELAVSATRRHAKRAPAGHDGAQSAVARSQGTDG